MCVSTVCARAGRASRLALPLPVQLALENCSPESTRQNSPQDAVCGPWGTVNSQILEFVPAVNRGPPAVAAHAIPGGAAAAAAAYSPAMNGHPGGNRCYSRGGAGGEFHPPVVSAGLGVAVSSTATSAELHVAVPPMGMCGPQFENPAFSSLSASAFTASTAAEPPSSASADGLQQQHMNAKQRVGPYSSATLQLHSMSSAPVPHSGTATSKSTSLAALSVPLPSTPKSMPMPGSSALDSFLPKGPPVPSCPSMSKAMPTSMIASQLPALSESPSHTALSRARLHPHNKSEPPPSLMTMSSSHSSSQKQKDQQSISTSNYSELSSALQMFTRQIDASCVVVEAVIGRGIRIHVQYINVLFLYYKSAIITH